LFPDLIRKIDAESRSIHDASAKTTAENLKIKLPKIHKSGVLPPPSPDVSWLSEGILEDKDQITDVPGALVLMTDNGAKGSVSLALEKSGYLVEYAETVDDALHRLTSIAYDVVALHSGFERGGGLAESTIHNYLAKLPMARRRRIYYILLGPDFQTLYDLEALSLSANLVVNDADVEHLPAIFKKSFQDYIELFGPILEFIETNR